MVRAHHTEVIAFRSELLSLHCPRHPLLRALLPACADPQVFTRQDCPAYAGEPLHTVGLLEAAHQYSLQDMRRSASTPILTSLPTQEWQFKNLPARKSCWAEAPIKIARMTLTLKLDGNWSSFQLANSAPPLSVTDSAIAPSASMLPLALICKPDQ